jgi:uncharacterized protein YaiI (UPF0178 family)
MSAAAQLSSILKVTPRARGVVTAIAGANITVAINGVAHVYAASGFSVGDEVIVQNGALVKVAVAIDVVMV